MGRTHWHPFSCKVCQRTRDEVGHISQTGLCLDCACERAISNNAQLMAKTGPYFEHWQRRIVAGALGVPDTAS